MTLIVRATVKHAYGDHDYVERHFIVYAMTRDEAIAIVRASGLHETDKVEIVGTAAR